MPAYNRYTVARLRELCENRGINTHDYKYKSEFVNVLIDDDAQRMEVIDDDVNGDVEQNESHADTSDDDNYNDVESVAASESVNVRVMNPAEQAAGDTQAGESVAALQLKLELVRAQQAAAESSWRIEKERIKLTGSDTAAASSSRSLGGDTREIKGLLPQMTNDEAMAFFQSYERVMILHNVDYMLWARYLPSQMTAKALKIYNRLSLEQSTDYHSIKDAILKGYNLTESTYLKVFQTLRRTGNTTYQTHLLNLREAFERYLQASNIVDFEGLIDDNIKNKFLEGLPPNVHAFVTARQPKSADDCAKYADLCYEVSKIERDHFQTRSVHTPFVQGRPGMAPTVRGPSTSWRSGMNAQVRTPTRPVFRPQGTPFRPAYNRFANGTLHNGVYNRPAFGNSGEPKRNGNTNFARANSTMFARNAYDVNCYNDIDYNLCGRDENVDACEHDNETELDENQRYIIPLYIGGIARIGLRDTGNMGSVLVSEHVVTPTDYVAGKFVHVKGVFDKKPHRLPMAKINIQSPRFGYENDVEVEAAVCSLPTNIDCVIGNSFFKEFTMLHDIIQMRDETAGAQSELAPRSDSAGSKRITCQSDTISQRAADVKSNFGTTGENSTDRTYVKRTAVTDERCRTSGHDGVSPEYDTSTAGQTVRRHRPESDSGGAAAANGNTSRVWGGVDPRSSAVVSDLVTVTATTDGSMDETVSIDRDRLPTGGETSAVLRTDEADITHGESMTVIDGFATDDVAGVITRSKATQQVARSEAANDKQGMTETDKPDDRRTADETDTTAAPSSESEETFGNLMKSFGQIDISDNKLQDDTDMTQTAFKEEQQADSALADLWHKAELGVSWLTVMDGLLYRKIPDHVNSEIGWALVLPKTYADKVIRAAHSAPTAGHFGVKKCEEKIASLFFFPKMRQRIGQFIRTCRQCQMIKPRLRSERQPLQKVDIMPKGVFEDVTIDILGGDWPVTQRKNRFMLTAICNLSKWTDIIPLKSLKASAIADALIEYFSRVGLPKILRSDNMPSFRSELLDALRSRLGIEGRFSVPFHHESQGSVERVQGTIETIMRKFVQDNPSQWDKFLPYVLFALREVKHSSTGYSASEMVFGKPFRGLLRIMRDTWTGRDPMVEWKNMSTVEYMEQLNEKIESIHKIARENTERSQAKMKQAYDKKSTVRTLQPGDLALILMPTSGNKVLAVWDGPYKVAKRLPNNNYQLLMNNRRAVFHINSLRKYYMNDEDSSDSLHMMVIEDVDGDELLAEWEQLPTDTVPEDRQTSGKTDMADSSNSKFHIAQRLTVEQKGEFQQMLAEFPDVFTEKPGKTDKIKHRIQVTDEKPCYQPSYRIPETLRQSVEQELSQMLEDGVIQHDDETSHNSPLVIVRKKDEGLRLCNNFIALNNKTVTEPYMMTNMTELLCRAAGSTYISRIDLKSYYFQVELEPESRKYTGFQTPFGSYSYLRMPQGLKNAPSTAQKLANMILRGLHRFAGSLIDDIVIFSMRFHDHLNHVRQVLERLRDAGLTANTSKCQFAENKLLVLGHLLENGRIYPDEGKVKAVLEWPIPRTKTQLKSFLGLAGFFRQYISHFATTAFPLTELVKKGSPERLKWTKTQQEAFDGLRRALTSKPVLRPPDMTKDFQLWVDSSRVAGSAILMQLGDENESPVGHVICYASRKLLPRERLYPIVELELAAICFGLLKFKHYVYGKHIDVYSDHAALRYLNSLSKHSSRLARYNTIIQEFDITPHHISGKQQIADALTRQE